MAVEQEFIDDLPFLVECGLIAIKQGDEESAKKLFNAVGVLAPQDVSKKMGYGLIALHKMDLKNAQKYFQEIVKQEPKNWRAISFLAFAQILMCVKEEASTEEKQKFLQQGAELAQQVVNESDSESTKQLAQSLLDWETELQKVG